MTDFKWFVTDETRIMLPISYLSLTFPITSLQRKLHCPSLTATWRIMWTLMCYSQCLHGGLTMNLSSYDVWRYQGNISTIAMGSEILMVIVKWYSKKSNFPERNSISIKTEFDMPNNVCYILLVLALMTWFFVHFLVLICTLLPLWMCIISYEIPSSLQMFII